MPASKRSARVTDFFAPATKQPKTATGDEKHVPDDEDDDDDFKASLTQPSSRPISQPSRHRASKKTPLQPSRPSSLNALPCPKTSLPKFPNSFFLPAASNDAENRSFITEDSVADDAGFTEDDLLALPVEELDAIESVNEDCLSDGEVELELLDEDLDIPVEELNKKEAFYKAIEIPSSAEQMPADVFLQILQGDPDIKQQVIAYASACMPSDRDASSVPTDGFLKNHRPNTWESNCPASDQLWNEWLSECKSLRVPNDILNTASKMPGPYKANLNIIWHYPTYSAGRIQFGFTADPKNPCISFQNRKIGPNVRVCTNDIIPFRAHYTSAAGADWPSFLPNAAQVLEKSVNLTMRLLSESRVVLLIGKHVRNIIYSQLEKDPSIEIHKLFVPAEGVQIYREAPHILVVRDVHKKNIKNLIFLSQHGQSFFYCSDQRVGLYHDFLWNAACAIAKIPVLNSDVFYRVTFPKTKLKVTVGGQRKNDQLALALVQRNLEKSDGVVVPDAIALQMFKPTINRNPEWWAKNLSNRGDRTVTQMVMQLFSSKAIDVQRAQGFPGLAKGRQKGLDKALETHKNQKMARMEAVLNAYQSRQLLAKPKTSLTKEERGAVESLEPLRACSETGELTPKSRKWRDTHVIYWAKKTPYGMRFEHDGAGPTAPSPTLYDDCDHPCLSLYRQFNKKDKDRLAAEWAQQQNTK